MCKVLFQVTEDHVQKVFKDIGAYPKEFITEVIEAMEKTSPDDFAFDFVIQYANFSGKKFSDGRKLGGIDAI